MKKVNRTLVITAALIAFMLSSCASTSKWGRSVDAELEQINGKMAKIDSLTTELEAATAEEKNIEATVAKLTTQTEDITKQLDSLPAKTLQELVSAIQVYLGVPVTAEADSSKTAATPAAAPADTSDAAAAAPAPAAATDAAAADAAPAEPAPAAGTDAGTADTASDKN